MSEEMKENSPDGRSDVKKEMTRRQFLTYTLGGTTGFLAAGMLVPMVRFAVDPLLQPKSKAQWIKVAAASDITEEPSPISFTVRQVDAWYESDVTKEAWISKDKEGNIFALSPTCKHLGCRVDWNKGLTQYLCPCHGALYTKEGKDLKVASEPLDEYAVEIRDGNVYLGELHSNQKSRKKEA